MNADPFRQWGSTILGNHLLRQAEKRLVVAEIRAHGVPLDEHDSLRDFVVDRFEAGDILTLRRRAGEAGRPSIPPRGLAVLIAAWRRDGGSPEASAGVAERFDVRPDIVKEAPDKLRRLMRRHSPDAGADVLDDRRQALIAEAGDVLHEMDGETETAHAARAAQRAGRAR